MADDVLFYVSSVYDLAHFFHHYSCSSWFFLFSILVWRMLADLSFFFLFLFFFFFFFASARVMKRQAFHEGMRATPVHLPRVIPFFYFPSRFILCYYSGGENGMEGAGPE